jgi:peroxiredoxin
MRTTVLALILLGLPASALDDEKAPDFTLPDLQGKPHTLYALKERKAVVLLFLGIECPRSRAAEPRLMDLAKAYGEKGASFFAINSNWNETSAEIADYVKKAGFTIPVLKDDQNRVADLFKIRIQPTAVVLDGTFALRYRGLIDDHKIEEFVRAPHLKNALEAVVAGRAVEVKATDPEGCTVRRVEKATSQEVTYAKHVAPILFKHCVGCHRPGQVGPFSLESYEQASAWSSEIVAYTKRKSMPPWKPVTNEGFYYNERRLSAEELAILERWHRNGAPEGDPKDLPRPPSFVDGWMLGKPDAVLTAEGGYVVGPRGRDEYRCYVLPTNFDEDKWVVGVEYKPGNPRAVHHIIGYLDGTTQAEKKDAADPAPGYRTNGAGPNILPSGSLAGWAPGNMPRMLPAGVGRRLRKGERIVLETHYHRTGREEKDEGAEVALYFAKEPVKKMLQVHMIANVFLRIPAGAPDHKVVANFTVPADVHAYDVMPHMHLLGREMSVVATFPDGAKKDLVIIKDWDFAWQETYQFREPLPLPKGTKIRVEATYDNSEKNKNNPSNPPRPVRWGEQTTDEMCIAFIHYTVDGEDRRKPARTEDNSK